MTMNYLTDLFKSAQEHQQIAIFIGLATVMLLLLVYMFVKSMFSSPASARSTTAKTPAVAVPVAQALHKLQAATQEGSVIFQQLHDAMAEKDLLIAEKQLYIEKLAKQEADLQAQLKQGFSPAEAVEKQYRGQVSALQAQLARAGQGRFWGGLFTGVLLTALLVAAYVAYLKIGKGIDLSNLLVF